MGIRQIARRAAGRVSDGINKAAQLSPKQLEEVEERRQEYLSQKPDPTDAVAEELTMRLLASCGVEIHQAYLQQIDSLYSPVDPLWEYEDGFDAAHNVRFFSIEKWVSDPNENDLEKLVSVYATLAEAQCNIALIFHRTKAGVKVQMAVTDVLNSSNNVDVDSYVERLRGALRGNFPGSQIGGADSGTPSSLEDVEGKSVVCMSNLPGAHSEKFSAQTIEKLLDGIVPTKGSDSYTLVLMASPIQDVEERKLRLAELYTALAPYASWQTNFTYSESSSTSSSATVGINAGVSVGSQQGTNANIAQMDGETKTDTSARTDSQGSATTDTHGNSISEAEGTNQSISAGVSLSEGGQTGVELLGVKARASLSATEFVSTTGGSSTTSTISENVSQAVSRNVSQAVSRSLGRAVSNSVSRAAGVFSSTSLGGNFGASFARSSTTTAIIGKNEGITQSFTNYSIKHALDLLQEQAKRYEEATALGMWDFAAYVLSEDPTTANNVAHSLLALTQGEGSHVSRAAINSWRGNTDPRTDTRSGAARTICSYIQNVRHPLFGLDPGVTELSPTYSVYPTMVTATTALTGRELSYSLNFPSASVAGLPVIECVPFGRNITTFSGEGTGSIDIGSIFHMHQSERTRVALDRQSLASHVFVTGSTGAGKTTAVCRLLDQAREEGVAFLVVEPAKGEYKDVFGSDPEVSVFGTNPQVTPLLRLNPFAFPVGIHVLEHMDRLVEILNMCWPMYAAMPAVLKQAIEMSYEDCGWDPASSTNRYADGLFPTFADVARNVRQILDSSDYDAENKGAYKGALLTRLTSLTNGLNGMMLGQEDIPAEVLFDGCAVVDLSRVGSSETKSLLMGLLVLKLQEHRMATRVAGNAPLKHLTVLEEAHNLLRRSQGTASEGADLAGKSVEMLANSIAEMRTYGEGFVIADQAPGLLDEAVIRNTNTKIIMRLPDLADRQLVGHAASLNEDQIVELARLPRGVAAVYQNDWVEAVLCAIERDEEAGPYVFEPADEPVAPPEPGLAMEVATDLLQGTVIVGDSAISDLCEELGSLGIDPSVRVRIVRELQMPRHRLDLATMRRIAPLLAELLPQTRRAAREVVLRTHEAHVWTDVTGEALEAEVGRQIDAATRLAVIQGLLTDLQLNELHDEVALAEWLERGVR